MRLTTGLATGGYGVPVNKNIELIAKVGLKSFFTGMGSKEELKERRMLADKLGLEYTSLHAPFKNAAKIWDDTPDGDMAHREIFDSIEQCSEIEVPVLVVHPFIGFDKHEPTPTGLLRFKRLADYAERVNVKLAIENVEGEEYLDYLLHGLSDYDSVGFCLDTGHMMCYNKGRDFLSEYGDRLIYTHVNDNMGCTYPDGQIFWLDDAHLLPFDGVQNWEALAKKIKEIGYKGPLTLELSKDNKPERTCNDIYKSMTAEEYVYEAAKRIEKFANMVEIA